MVDLLGQLVDRSLVVADEFEGHVRYRLLETIRQYAIEELDTSGLADETRRRHAAHWCSRERRK